MLEILYQTFYIEHGALCAIAHNFSFFPLPSVVEIIYITICTEHVAQWATIHISSCPYHQRKSVEILYKTFYTEQAAEGSCYWQH